MTKVICFLLGLVLLSELLAYPSRNKSFANRTDSRAGNSTNVTTYNPIKSLAPINIVAGVAPINGFFPVPASNVDFFYETYTRNILMDSTLIMGIPPISCKGLNCTSFLITAGLDLVRPADGGPNSTLSSGQPLDKTPIVIVDNAPAVHMEFYPVSGDSVFNQSTDCSTYGAASTGGIHICPTSDDTQIMAGTFSTLLQ